jgi:hypothetical protein
VRFILSGKSNVPSATPPWASAPASAFSASQVANAHEEEVKCGWTAPSFRSRSPYTLLHLAYSFCISTLSFPCERKIAHTGQRGMAALVIAGEHLRLDNNCVRALRYWRPGESGQAVQSRWRSSVLILAQLAVHQR